MARLRIFAANRRPWQGDDAMPGFADRNALVFANTSRRDSPQFAIDLALVLLDDRTDRDGTIVEGRRAEQRIELMM